MSKMAKPPTEHKCKICGIHLEVGEPIIIRAEILYQIRTPVEFEYAHAECWMAQTEAFVGKYKTDTQYHG